MKIDHLIKVASRMYGLSFVKSRLMLEQISKEYSNISEGEILKLIGERSIFYVGVQD